VRVMSPLELLQPGVRRATGQSPPALSVGIASDASVEV
jgi:hypothetical protein